MRNVVVVLVAVGALIVGLVVGGVAVTATSGGSSLSSQDQERSVSCLAQGGDVWTHGYSTVHGGTSRDCHIDGKQSGSSWPVDVDR